MSAQTHCKDTRTKEKDRLGGPYLLLGSQYLIEYRGSLFLVRLLSKCELRNQDLASLGKHSLLAGGQAAIMIPAPQVTYYLGNLDDIA